MERIPTDRHLVQEILRIQIAIPLMDAVAEPYLQ
ncbi:hypothetical protein Memar_0197 [Methanoculleus marisnigri JR1]|uniref:Uncharacterized protein n=1 Tax=Methanoculleus marisnigri (strain ATCC 35101 / DSM 1498 / JR1) TaxID=368407 RepID=A3CRY1_METMJ|nr:hypothetical protein Memar_0197 [Methanoculleus marisnigri JR1]